MRDFFKLLQSGDVLLVGDRVFYIFKSFVPKKHGQQDLQRFVLDHVVPDIQVLDAYVYGQS